MTLKQHGELDEAITHMLMEDNQYPGGGVVTKMYQLQGDQLHGNFVFGKLVDKIVEEHRDKFANNVSNHAPESWTRRVLNNMVS